jgi:hypothetical protein
LDHTGTYAGYISSPGFPGKERLTTSEVEAILADAEDERNPLPPPKQLSPGLVMAAVVFVLVIWNLWSYL